MTLCEGSGWLLGSTCSQTQEVIQGVSEFLTSLCSLSNLDSVPSGNPSFKSKERWIKPYYAYNQFEIWFSLLFSLREPWAPIFSVCQYISIVQSSTCSFLWFPFVFSSTTAVFYHSCFIFKWLKKYTDFFQTAQFFTWSIRWRTSLQLIYFPHKVRNSMHLGQRKKRCI